MSDAPASGSDLPEQNALALIGLVFAIIGAVVGGLFGAFILLGLAGGLISLVGFTRAHRMRAVGSVNHRRGFALAGMIVGFGGVLLNIAYAIGTTLYYSALSSSS